MVMAEVMKDIERSLEYIEEEALEDIEEDLEDIEEEALEDIEEMKRVLEEVLENLKQAVMIPPLWCVTTKECS